MLVSGLYGLEEEQKLLFLVLGYSANFGTKIPVSVEEAICRVAGASELDEKNRRVL